MDALAGNRETLEASIGFEPVGRAVSLLLLQRLNPAILVEDERWRAADSAWQQITGSTVGQIEVPQVPAANIHDGPRRSLIDAPVSAFPNVSVMAYMTVPSVSQFDQLDSSDITLFVEALQISGPAVEGSEVDHEAIVHRRIQRTTEAIKNVIEGDPTLLGTVHALSSPPRGGIGNSSWVNRTDDGAGARYIRHGSRLQYTATRHHHPNL